MKQQDIDHSFVINNLDELLIALESADKKTITTPDNAISYMGLLYIEQMLEIAYQTHKNVYEEFLLNAKDNAAICHLAIKGKIKHILFTGNKEMFLKLSDIAKISDKTLYFTDNSKKY